MPFLDSPAINHMDMRKKIKKFAYGKGKRSDTVIDSLNENIDNIPICDEICRNRAAP